MINSGNIFQGKQSDPMEIQNTDSIKRLLKDGTKAENISIDDDEKIINATNVESALEENRTAIDVNTTKLSGIEEGAEVNNISDADAIDLTDSGDTILHKHDIYILEDGSREFSGVVDLGSTGQIKFPSTENPSSDINTLDGCKRYAWTPSLNFDGGTTGITYVKQNGYYIKIGRLVTVFCDVAISSKGTSTGKAQVSGLPFTTSNNNIQFPVNVAFFNISFVGQYYGVVAANNTVIKLQETNESGTKSNIDDTNFADNSTFAIMASYYVD